MFTVSFGNFAKRKNSTARPASLAASFSVALKENTSLDAPTFKLTAPTFDYNYCQWGSRYYYVVDIISERNNGWSVVCELDEMATYRTEIHNTTAFVDYAAQGNNQIPDTRLEVEYGVGGVNTQTGGSPVPYMDVDINDSGFFITVVGQSSTDTYFISAAALEALFDNIATWADVTIDKTDITTILSTAFQQLISSGSAADCIRDAYVLPIVAPLSVLGSAETLRLGLFNTGLKVNRVIGAGNCTDTETITIPHQYTDWRKQSPYEVVQLFLPLYGTINIPSDIAADSTALVVKCILNVRSGDFTYYVSGSGRGGKEIVVGGNCAAPLAVGASNLTYGQAAGALSAGVSQALMGNIAAIGNTVSMVSPVPQSVGMMGGISNREPRVECYVYYRNVSAVPSSVAVAFGLPYFASARLGDLAGYVKTRGVSVGGTLHGEQYDRVNQTLDGGAFIE